MDSTDKDVRQYLRNRERRVQSREERQRQIDQIGFWDSPDSCEEYIVLPMEQPESK